MFDAGTDEAAVWAYEKLTEIAAARMINGNVMMEFEVLIKEKSDMKETPENWPVGR